jgi:hypothetical protein
MKEPARQAAVRPMPRQGLALVAACGVIVVVTWWHKRSPGEDAPQLAAQAPTSQAASGVAPAVPALVASLPPALAASVISPEPGKPAQAAAPNATAPQRHRKSIDTQLMAQLRSPAEALRQVQLALGAGTPQQVLEAAQTLEGCKSAAREVGDLHALRDRPEDATGSTKKIMREMGGVTNEMIELAEIEARRCQAFDGATMGRRRELFQRAYDGGAEGSAAAYLRMLQKPEKATADPALVARLQADVRTAAADGDADALLYLAMAPDEHATVLGVTTARRAGYKAAWKTIQDERSQGWAATFEKFMPPAATLSAAEQAEADALAQQVLDTWRRKRKVD